MKNNRLRWVILLFLLLTGQNAMAYESCSSAPSTELIECFSIRVTLDGINAQKVNYSKKTYSYKSPKYTNCPDGKCQCEEDVSYIKFTGKQAGLKKINAMEYAAAKKVKCTAENTTVTRIPIATYASRNLVSTAFSYNSSRPEGGCQGNSEIATYNSDNATKYKVGDIVEKNNLPTLKEKIVKKFFEENYKDSEVGFSEVRKVAFDALGEIGKNDIYVQREKVFTNVPVMMYCTYGTFHPVEIPPNLIKESFRGMLIKDNGANNAKR